MAMRNHIFKLHDDAAGAQKCRLIKVEGADKRYWLLLDAPLTATLGDIDFFLRHIWLECCGHMSAFIGPGYEDYPMDRKLTRFSEGEKVLYEYDFGDTTQLLVTFLGKTRRRPWPEPVRLLARNKPIEWFCACGRSADLVYTERLYRGEDPFLCEDCAKEQQIEMEMTLPVTNSPRMGVCAYDGDFDRYSYEEYQEYLEEIK